MVRTRHRPVLRRRDRRVRDTRSQPRTTVVAGILIALYATPTLTRGQERSNVVWLSVLTVVWLAAVIVVSVDFVWLSVPLLFLYLLMFPLRIALGAVVAITAVVIWAEALDDGLVAAEVAGPILGAGFALVACVSYRRLATEHEQTRRALDELEATRHDLARSQHERGMLDERRRMAREVHDTIAQDLAGILLIARSPSTSNSTARIEDLAATALHEARRIVDALGPVELEATSLATALAQLAANERNGDPAVEFTVTGEPRDLPQPPEAMLLRVAQGALANSRTHARASTVYITLSYLDDEVAIDIVDDGQGFNACDDLPRVPGRFGLSVIARTRRTGRRNACDRIPTRVRHGHPRSSTNAMISVLIVDDHPLFRAGLRDAINTQPDLCVAADLDTAEAAIDYAIHHHVDIVLMDLRMTGMGGAAGTAAITALDNPPNVIVFTTFSTDADITAALDAEARGYILKDALPDDVFAAIRRVASGGAVLAPVIADRVVNRDKGMPSDNLSNRELDVLELLAEGLGNRAIAQHLHLSEATIKTHLAHIYKKLHVDNRTAAVVTARGDGIIRSVDHTS